MPPIIGTGGGKGKAKSAKKKPNAVRRIMDREESRERRVRESSAATSSNGDTAAPTIKPARLRCPNKACRNPNVQAGTCHGCGQVVDDSNIVSEITFGEAGNGAAVVQGTHLAADQGGVRSVGGMAFRRVAGGGASEARERSLRESKSLLQQFTQELRIPTSLADTAYRLYRVASNHNFIQGRRKVNVAAICLYAACRKETNNKIMLIDLADLVKTDVFLLGRGYKEFLSQFPDHKEGTQPIIMEDLIYRFASRLEFFNDTNKVAESAVRIAARMRFDNMTHGRRPAGICGAALIMAARAHNYRRTVREVVYIAKVTMTTLQERMEEFANVPSAQMTIREFHDNAFLETAADPPSIMKQERLKRKAQELLEARASVAGESTEAQGSHSDKRQRTGEDSSQPTSAPAEGAAVPTADAAMMTPAPSASPAPASTLDKDGFVIPPLPLRTTGTSVIAAASSEVESQLEALAGEFADPAEEEDEDDDDDDEMGPTSEMAMAIAQGITIPGQVYKQPSEKAKTGEAKGRTKKPVKKIPINEEWEMDEANLEQEMEGHLNDPELINATTVVAHDIEEKRAQAAATAATSATEDGAAAPQEPAPYHDPNDPRFTPPSKVSDNKIIGEDEFADDPEVMYCRLGEEEVKIKEQIWANHNKDYMRQVQQKIFTKKMAENEPPKARRNRAKKPRIGEGQASPAQSAEEAAQNMLRTRGISTKLDYSRLGAVFDMSKRGPGSMYDGGSSGTQSAAPSAFGSEAGGSDDEDDVGNALTVVTSAPSTTNATPAQPADKIPAAIPGQADEEGGDDDFDATSTNLGDGYEESVVQDDFDPFADEHDDTEY
ncbi:hypothetical protein B0H63DRAFT_388944 [Podospora didyma]|uniref:Cyclin-like domain-containing protein n=1 Tax=Podospora didyma TaxID=330526 RepID=A0AAE0NWN6_9PEZI|nr:hypothetical protein B0H63DRAFT_388944 [Podospora didyma]